MPSIIIQKKLFFTLFLTGLGFLGFQFYLPNSAEKSKRLLAENKDLKRSAEHPQNLIPNEWDKESYAVHEWGTFTTLQGSDGVTLPGLQHEEWDLPEFVYDLRDYRGIAAHQIKMETPVIYFYSPEKAAQKIYAHVGFPKGVITQWYPVANQVNFLNAQNQLNKNIFDETPWDPDRHSESAREKIENLRDGFISWGSIGQNGEVRTFAQTGLLTVYPQSMDQEYTKLPEVDSDDPWRFCREVDANVLSVCRLNDGSNPRERGTNDSVVYDREKCLFYRGLGDFSLPFTGKVKNEKINLDQKGLADSYQVSLELVNTNPDQVLKHIFLVFVQDERAGFAYFDQLQDKLEIKDLSFELSPIEQSTEELVEKLAQELTKTGLYHKEALAMARTWQHGYFQEEGLRALYVLPESLINQELPLTIKGFGSQEEGVEPYSLVRTFVGRTELLSPEREKAILEIAQDYLQGNEQAKQSAAKEFEKWGRFAIPYLQRVKALTQDKSLIEKIEEKIEQFENLTTLRETSMTSE